MPDKIVEIKFSYTMLYTNVLDLLNYKKERYLI